MAKPVMKSRLDCKIHILSTSRNKRTRSTRSNIYLTQPCKDKFNPLVKQYMGQRKGSFNTKVKLCWELEEIKQITLM